MAVSLTPPPGPAALPGRSRAAGGDRRPRLREIPVQERPRERLARVGATGLSTAELIALLWGSGVSGRSAVDLAETAIAAHGGLAALSRAGLRELTALPGVGQARAAQLAAAFELGRRLAADWPTNRLSVRSPRDLADRLVPAMGHLEREELRVVLLNTKNAVLAIETVYVGNVSTALVRIGELFRDAVRQHAAGLILVHNHPSGDPAPSPDDLHLTAEAVAAGRLLDVPVLDHLIVGQDGFISLRDRGIPFDRPGGRSA
ncbi:MAG TPA: DNA repair protein RadC [Candidatus Limnocylindrales bacterium]|nr:DNA repair protein RadC [Candidatus Limnocylindrales bacterium]